MLTAKRRHWLLPSLLLLAGTAPLRGAPIGADGFCGAPSRVEFETGGQELPIVPGVRFLFESIPGAPNWFAGVPTRVGGGFVPSASFGLQAYANLVATSNPPDWSHLAIQFSDPQRAVGAYLGAIPNFLEISARVVTVQARGADGSLLDEFTVSVPELGEPPIFVGFHDERGIARLEWRLVAEGFLGIDNLLYGAPASDCVATTEVPTLSAWSLMLLVVGLAWVALRRL